MEMSLGARTNVFPVTVLSEAERLSRLQRDLTSKASLETPARPFVDETRHGEVFYSPNWRVQIVEHAWGTMGYAGQ